MSSDHYMCTLDPETKTNLKVYLFKDVKNVEAIRNNVVTGGWKCAVIKASLILDIFQVAVAANRAVLSERSLTMVTKTVYSEILYNLSLTKNISQSLSKFGIEKDNSLLICFLITDEGDNNEEKIIEQIDGEICPMSELSNFSNLKQINSAYKLNSVKSGVDLLDVILSRMVTKSFVSH